jgi:hypothetical protein
LLKTNGLVFTHILRENDSRVSGETQTLVNQCSALEKLTLDKLTVNKDDPASKQFASLINKKENLDNKTNNQSTEMKRLQSLLVKVTNEEQSKKPEAGFFSFMNKVAKTVGISDSVESVTKKIATLQSQQRATAQEGQLLETEFANSKLQILTSLDLSVREKLKGDLQVQLNGLVGIMQQEKTVNKSTIVSLQKQINDLNSEIQIEKDRGNLLIKRFDNINEIFEFEARTRALPKREVAVLEIPEIPSGPDIVPIDEDEEPSLSRSAGMGL